MSHNPTEEQLACIEAAKVGGKSVMVDALAGCAKTTTTVMMAQHVKVPALELVFNKRNAVEMTPKMPGNFKVQTMNGLGFGAWMRGNPQVPKWEVDGRKLGKLVSQLAKDRKMELTSDQWEDARKLVNAAMLVGVTPGDEGTPLLLDRKEVWWDLADELLLTDDEFDFLYELSHEVLVQSIALARQGTISFDDQVYCPTLLGGKFPQYPFIGTDESQDLNALNHEMIARALRPDGRLLVVGDPKQSIYQFRGACQDSMEKMLGLRPSASWQRLPLATTFRCPKVVVARQQGHAPGFTAWHTNVEGEVHSLPRFSSSAKEDESLEEAYWSFSDLEKLLPPGGQMAVLCRNNGPLMALAFKLLRDGVGVVMLGRDIGKGLIALAKKILPEDGTPRDTCAGEIEEWREGECSLARANGHEEKVSGISDRAECLQAALANAGVADAGGMRKALSLLFSRENGLVTIGSIHRAKGQEWDLVAHLDPWRLPSKYAREALLRGDPRQMEQEKNLLYVAETRTKNVLVNLNLEDFHS